MKTTLNAPLSGTEIERLGLCFEALKRVFASAELGTEPLTVAERLVNEAFDFRVAVQRTFHEANRRQVRPVKTFVRGVSPQSAPKQALPDLLNFSEADIIAALAAVRAQRSTK